MVEILMAVYNGERFIKDQLDSILSQSYKDWRLLVLDDGSLDCSLKIVKSYANRIPTKIKVFHSSENSKNAKVAFSKLLQKSTAQYVCFCDHDDVWHKDKLKISVNAMKEIEKENKNLPVLIYSDLFVVDENLNVLYESMIKSQKLKFKEKELNELIVQNNVTGCTVLVNDRLIKVCGKIPKNALMHDWWLALVAVSFGKIKFLKERTVYYRQHEKNCIGAKDVRSFKYLSQRILKRKEIKKSIADSFCQCEEFLNQYAENLGERERKILENYLEIRDVNKFRRILKLFCGRYFKDSLFRKVGQIFYI